MTLNKKIFLLFLSVAIVPLVLFALVARNEALALADTSAREQLVAGTRAAVDLLAQEAAAGQSALRVLSTVATEDAGPDPAVLRRAMAGSVGPPLSGFHYMAILDEGEGILTSAGTLVRGGACAEGGYSSPVRLEAPWGQGALTVVGDYWPRAAEALAIGDGLWVYDDRGQLVWGSSCETGPAPRLGETLEESEIRVLEPDPEAGERSQTTVLATVPGREWTIVVRGSIPSRAPLEGFFSDYWIFVMAMGAMSLIAFALFLRPVTGYVRDLTQAVERVAGGDLRPWFPTPRDDEIGRLSVAFYDMTERLREMVAQVERSSRLAVLGKLSAYLAHEIRNPLSSVQMNLQRLERWRRKGEIPQRFGDAIEISLREVGRLSAAVSNILQLSPSRSRPKELVALHGLMSEVGQLLQPDFARRDVHIMWELNAEVDRVLGDPGQLKSVVINLMLNALDAQPEGGELTVQSRLEPGDREAGGPFLELRFRDRGPGVATEIQDRIFQPFFSTKGEGSGIGLAVVSQTIRNHGGEVYLVERARLAEGAEFVVRLPLAPVVSERSPGRLTPRMTSWMDEPAEE